jgi:diadenylate cyclase
MENLQYIWFNYLANIVDILAVAYLLYAIMALVKGTRAVQIIIGILILAIITAISGLVLHLQALSWILEKFWFAGVVIFAVVFQPEIRSGLARLGSHPWGRIITPGELSFVEEIIEAVIKCMEAKIGAILVIEQDTGLRGVIESGTIINGQVSWELIYSIFNPKSPLHDGAVIIENSRLIAAGCVLPLSHEQGISKVLGTRHRAALGLSEASDAIIIVVSEETGNISLAKEGKLESGVQIEDLKGRLVQIFNDRTRSAKQKI